jgi:hypothetical protein
MMKDLEFGVAYLNVSAVASSAAVLKIAGG